jgi:hypothetical protein
MKEQASLTPALSLIRERGYKQNPSRNVAREFDRHLSQVRERSNAVRVRDICVSEIDTVDSLQ